MNEKESIRVMNDKIQDIILKADRETLDSYEINKLDRSADSTAIINKLNEVINEFNKTLRRGML